MGKYRLVFLFFALLLIVNFFGEDTKTLTIKKSNTLSHATIVFLASLPLTLATSMLSYKFYKMYQTSDATYSLNKKETKNIIYVGVSLSLIYSIVDYINVKKKSKNGNKGNRKQSTS